MINYEKSTESKKEDLREFLNNWFEWRLNLEIINGDTYLAANKEAIVHEWVSSGFPMVGHFKTSSWRVLYDGHELNKPSKRM